MTTKVVDSYIYPPNGIIIHPNLSKFYRYISVPTHLQRVVIRSMCAEFYQDSPKTERLVYIATVRLAMLI